MRMGFGFNLFFVLVLCPLTVLLLITWVISRKLIVGKVLGVIWGGIFGLMFFSGLTQWLTAKTVLEQDDYYGKYVINRDYFKGEQTDWQYNHFRFEITKEDSILFHVTDKEKILKTYKGRIRTTTPYKSARLIIDMEKPSHHILESNPTIYRSAWSFYLVFYSDKFHNVFFKKGKWKSID